MNESLATPNTFTTPAPDSRFTSLPAANEFGNIYFGDNAQVVLGNQFNEAYGKQESKAGPVAFSFANTSRNLPHYIDTVTSIFRLVRCCVRSLESIESIRSLDKLNLNLDPELFYDAAESLDQLGEEIYQHSLKVVDSLFKRPLLYFIEDCERITTRIQEHLEHGLAQHQRRETIDEATASLQEIACNAFTCLLTLPKKQLEFQMFGHLQVANTVICRELILTCQRIQPACQNLQESMRILQVNAKSRDHETTRSRPTGHGLHTQNSTDNESEALSDKALTTIEAWLSKNKQVIQDTVHNVLHELDLEGDRAVRVKIIDSLRFPEMDSRHDAVYTAHENTLDWLYDLSGVVQQSGDNFAQWLIAVKPTNAVPYWIKGKPGSGKSTLVKRVLHDRRTQDLGQRWSGQKSFIIASCFFWASGVTLQKSLLGLLQTLLCQLLQARNDFQRHLFEDRWVLHEFSRQTRDIPWTLAELQSAISQYVAENLDSLNILFMIDGLDEFDGTHEERIEICTLMRELSKCPNAKVCVSSRPWNVYSDAFRDSPTLCMEHVNNSDIYRYVEDKFEKSYGFTSWREAEPDDATALFQEIVRKADGVFLWIHLVVRSLLKGLDSGDDMRELSARLAQIPTDLEALFEQMLSQIEYHQQETASHIFGIALLGEHFVTTYSFLHDKTIRASKGSKNLVSLITSRDDIEIRRINARSLGLLDFVRQPIIAQGLQTSLRKVRFMHRTARDFFASKIMLDRLALWRAETWCAPLELLRAQEALLREYFLKDIVFIDAAQQVAKSSMDIADQYHSMPLVITTISSMHAVLSAALHWLPEPDSRWWPPTGGLSSKNSSTAVVISAIQRGHHKLLSACLHKLSVGDYTPKQLGEFFAQLLSLWINDQEAPEDLLGLEDRPIDVVPFQIVEELFRLGMATDTIAPAWETVVLNTWTLLLRELHLMRTRQRLRLARGLVELFLRHGATSSSLAEVRLVEVRILEVFPPTIAQHLLALYHANLPAELEGHSRRNSQPTSRSHSAASSRSRDPSPAVKKKACPEDEHRRGSENKTAEQPSQTSNDTPEHVPGLEGSNSDTAKPKRKMRERLRFWRK